MQWSRVLLELAGAIKDDPIRPIGVRFIFCGCGRPGEDMEDSSSWCLGELQYWAKNKHVRVIKLNMQYRLIWWGTKHRV